MTRRDLIGQSLSAVCLAIFSSSASTASPPKRDRINVAFLLGDSANVIDTAGPWEVFQDVMVETAGHHENPFALYTVAAEAGILAMTGGLQVKPQYTIENAPTPNVIVVPAQKSNKASLAWLKSASQQTDVTMSVCTGAFQLARAGLLKGISATTHHDFWDSFAQEFPDIELKRGLRFVDNGHIATSGGLTSGIDLALHIVGRYLGVDTAEATARYMEHSSAAWRDGLQVGRLNYSTPL